MLTLFHLEREREREKERGRERKCEYYLIKPHNMKLGALCHKQESVGEGMNIVYKRDLNSKSTSMLLHFAFKHQTIKQNY